MGQLADTIENTATALIPAAPVASAADLFTGPQLLQIFGEIVVAVAALELITAGASFSVEGYLPTAGLGNDGDSWLYAPTGDLFKKLQGNWYGRGNLRGLPGKDGTNGKNGINGKDGTNGLSTYQLWLQDGHAGTITQFLASLHGKDGIDGTNGADGNKIKWQSYAPTTEAGQPGDTWYHSISATKYALYECYLSAAVLQGSEVEPVAVQATNWRLRFTSPDAATATPGTGTGTANFPAQTPATTAGKSLMSTGTAGAEYWGFPNRVSYPLEFLNLMQCKKKFFQAAQLLRFEKDAAVASLTYSINGAAAVAVPFAQGASFYAPAQPIAVPAGAVVTWAITYANASNEAYAEIFAVETLPTL